MGIKKYLKPLIISAILIGFMSILLLFILPDDNPGFTPIIPIDSMGFQFFFIFTMIWVGSIIGILFGFLLAPLFLLIHKKVIGPNMTYGINELHDPRQNKFKGSLKGFFPALMALNFAIMFSGYTAVSEILFPNQVVDVVSTVLGVMILLALTPVISMALFVPVWFLQDSGIIYSNHKKLEKKKIPPEVRSVGGWYLYLLKGYAGISVIFSFYSMLSEFFASDEADPGAIMMFVPLPFIIALFMLPSIVIMDMTYDLRKKYIMKFAKMYGIVDDVQVKFEVIEK